MFDGGGGGSFRVSGLGMEREREGPVELEHGRRGQGAGGQIT